MSKMSLLHTIVMCYVVVTAATTKDEGELDAGLEFFEFDLEDKCISRNNILWDFYHGSTSDLKLLVQDELRRAELLKNEVKSNEGFRNTNISVSKTKRKLELLFSSGAALMDNNILDEFAKFAANAQAASTQANKSGRSFQHTQATLRKETNASTLAEVWARWTQGVQNASGDLTQQISLLDLEVEANGAENLEKYWLTISEVTSTDYAGLTKLWSTLAPLYQRLRQLLATLIATKFGKEVLLDPALLPVHLLGSLDSSDWVTAAENLGVFSQSQTFTVLTNNIKEKTVKNMYNNADELTAELHLGYLPETFFENSIFEDDKVNCVHFMEGTCKSDVTPKVLNCKADMPSVSTFLRSHREVANIKHHALASEVDNGQGFLLREGPRDSVMYEAISTATSLMAIHPDNLLRRGLIKSLDKDTNMTSLLIAALHIIPQLPLHLSYDLWRLEALALINKDEDITTTEPVTTALFNEETTVEIEDSENENVTDSAVTEEPTVSTPLHVFGRNNLSAHWWTVRGKYQGVGAPDQQTNYEDYLQDQLVVWNRPHISKFLGPILLFQFMENFKTGNTTENRELLKRLLQKGKSEPWELIINNLFNITKLDAQPMINYFKPLIAFLEKGAKFKEDSASSGFSDNDYNLFMQSSSISADTNPSKKDVKSASEDSNAVMIVLIGLAVVGSLAAVVSIARRRLLKRRQAGDRRRFSEG